MDPALGVLRVFTPQAALFQLGLVCFDPRSKFAIGVFDVHRTAVKMGRAHSGRVDALLVCDGPQTR